MVSGKFNHSIVFVKNKLFVFANRRDDWEVFDNICKKFIVIKSPEFISFPSKTAYSIENRIFVSQYEFFKIVSYDTNKNEWSEEELFCEVIKNLRNFFSVKVPCL